MFTQSVSKITADNFCKKNVVWLQVPGAVLTPRQHAVFCSSCVKNCVALVDLLRLTQTAAMEEKRMMLLRPFVFTNPSVMAVGE